MTFASTFGRVLSPTFQPKSQAVAAGGSWWDLDGAITSCVAAYQPKGAASYAASLIDLTGNSHVLSNSDYAPPWDAATGWCTGRWRVGYTYYGLITDIVPKAGYSIAILCERLFDAATAVFSSQYFELTLDYSADKNLWRRTTSAYGGTAIAGVFTLAGGKAYIDGTNVATLTDTTDSTAPVWIGRGDGYNSKIYIKAVSIYDAALTSSQVSSLSTAMAAL